MIILEVGGESRKSRVNGKCESFVHAESKIGDEIQIPWSYQKMKSGYNSKGLRSYSLCVKLMTVRMLWSRTAMCGFFFCEILQIQVCLIHMTRVCMVRASSSLRLGEACHTYRCFTFCWREYYTKNQAQTVQLFQFLWDYSDLSGFARHWCWKIPLLWYTATYSRS